MRSKFQLARQIAALAVIGGAVACLGVAALPAGQAGQAEYGAGNPVAELDASLEDLSPQEKDELRQKKERFDKLPANEQHRIRCLHAELERHPHGARLKQVASRYAEWLKTLSPGVRAELLELPPEERLERIRKFKEEQQAQRVRDVVATHFKSEDVRAVFTWLGKYAAAHEAELLALLGSEAQQFLRRMPKGPGRHIAIFRALQMRPPDRPLPQPTAEEFDELRASLSDEARSEFDKIAEDDQRLQLVFEWARAAMTARMMPPPVGGKELEEFYAKLSREERDYLDQLPRERLQHELRRMYYRNKIRQPEGGPQPPFFRRPDGRPPHFHGGPRNPRGNGPRGGGERTGGQRQPPFRPGDRPNGPQPPPPDTEEQPGF